MGLFNTIQYNTIQYNIIQYSTVQYNALFAFLILYSILSST